MIGYPEAPKAWSYTKGVSRVVGVDLIGNVVEGWMRRDELGDIVETCAECGQTAPCTDWLAHTVSAESLPQFCPNKAVIEALKP